MHSNLYETAAYWGQRVFATNSTATASFAWPAVSLTEPVINGTNGYVDMRATTSLSTSTTDGVTKTKDQIRNVEATRNVASMLFTGVGAAGTTFEVCIYGVREVKNGSLVGSTYASMWVHVPLYAALITLGSCVTGNASSEKFGDTIAVIANSTNATVQIWGNSVATAFDNMPAELDMDFRGFPFLLFQVRTGASATSMNVLIGSY